MRANSLLAIALALCSAASWASAQEAATQPASAPATEPAEEEKPPEKPFDVLNNTRLTGDWGGARKWLEDKGIDFELSLTTIYQQNAHGGLSTDNGHNITGSANYELSLDFEKMGLWKGGLLYTLAESSWGDDIGLEKVGNLFGTNGDAYLGNDPIQASEVWYQQSFFDNKVRVKAGKMDLYVDFDTNAYANAQTNQFLNPLLINMANIPFPLYPQGIMVAVQPTDWLYFQGAFADAQGLPGQTGFHTFYHDECYTFSILELGFTPTWKTPWGKLPGGYRFMLWYDPQPREVFSAGASEEDEEEDDALPSRVRTRRDNAGFAFNMDQLLFKENPSNDADSQGLGMFFRYGFAPGDVNLVKHFWSIGAQYQGLIPTRDNDVLGFGFAQCITGDDARRTGYGDHESTYELYYNIAVFPWFNLTPDFQYISDPGATDTTRDSFVTGVRLQMSF
jgi:porin